MRQALSAPVLLPFALFFLPVASAAAPDCERTCAKATAAKKQTCLQKCAQATSKGKLKDKSQAQAKQTQMRDNLCSECIGANVKTCCAAKARQGCELKKLGHGVMSCVAAEKRAAPEGLRKLVSAVKSAIQVAAPYVPECGSGFAHGLVDTLPNALKGLRALADALRDPAGTAQRIAAAARNGAAAAGRCLGKIKATIQSWRPGRQDQADPDGGGVGEYAKKVVNAFCSYVGKQVVLCAISGCNASLLALTKVVQYMSSLEAVREKAGELSGVCK